MEQYLVFLLRCALSWDKTRCGRCKSGGRCRQSWLFSAENGRLFGKVHCFFLSLGRKGTPLRPSGRKVLGRRAKWGRAATLSRMGCIGEPIYKEGGALFGTETLCISRKTLNSQLVKNVFCSACAHRWSLGRTKKTLPCLAFFT